MKRVRLLQAFVAALLVGVFLFPPSSQAMAFSPGGYLTPQPYWGRDVYGHTDATWWGCEAGSDWLVSVNWGDGSWEDRYYSYPPDPTDCYGPTSDRFWKPYWSRGWYTQRLDLCAGQCVNAVDSKTIYAGFYTGWEDWEPQGYVNRIEYGTGVDGYLPGVPPEAGRRWCEVPNVPGWESCWHEMMAGRVVSGGHALVYFRVFDSGNSSLPLTIASGMKLRWHQYNYQQGRVSVDGHFTDGTVMRGLGIVDQHGVNIHPASRTYGTGQWLWFEADLGPAVGKTLDYLMVAYDYGYSSGQFRAYFDNLSIGY